MKKPIILTIPKPCSENWDEMSAVPGGRFCTHCQEQVTDFSSLSDEEIQRLVSRSNGKICGNFYSSQLNRVLNVQRQSTSILPKLMLGTALTLSVLKAEETHGAAPDRSQTEITANSVQSQEPVQKGKKVARPPQPARIIEGTVTDQRNDKPLEGVSVGIKGTRYYMHTNKAGRFKISIPEGLKSERMFLEVSLKEYEPMRIPFSVADLPLKTQVKLRREWMTIGRIAIQ